MERGDQIANIWEDDDPHEIRRITYRELNRETRRMANVLRAHCIGKGDRVAICLPMIPEAAMAMLACARISAIHSVVFAGFSEEALHGRIVDAACKAVITADESLRGRKHIPLKKTVDHAIHEAPTVAHVFVVRRTGAAVSWHEGRDIWLLDALTQQRPYCPPEHLDSEDPLFFPYTSGSTGTPKGLMHTTDGDHERFMATYLKPYPGYYFIGDGCRRDADGYYWITGRVDDVLNVSGHRMGTAKVESALVEHAACAEAAVIGYPDEVQGQAIGAYVLLNEGYDDTDPHELKQTVRHVIGPIATPDLIVITRGPARRSLYHFASASTGLKQGLYHATATTIPCPGDPMNTKRQVIVIMTDTQRCDMLGCYGSSLSTPQLDRLAAGGLRCDRAYTCQPVCGPARSALFTGTYPHTNGTWANSIPLGDTIKTIGQRLTTAGLTCGYIGKWHLDGSDYFGTGCCPDGWDADTWYDMRNYLDELSEDDRRRSRDPQTNRTGIEADFTFGHRCSNRAIDFLEQRQDEDFLLVLSYDEPHGPYLCPEPFASMYRNQGLDLGPARLDDLDDKPEHQQVWSGGFCDRPQVEKEAFMARHADFFGCNSFVDHEIGRVLDTIDRLAPEALVIYTADHGDLLGSHGITNKGPAVYDPVARIPLIVRWPGKVPAASHTTAPMSHIDITPSILDYFSEPLSPALQGRSQLAGFRDPTQALNDAVFVEFGRYEVDHDGFGGFQPLRAIVTEEHKLVINLLCSDELYDQRSDPAELDNRIYDPALHTLRNQLHDRLIDWMNETRDPFRGYYWLNRPWREDAPAKTWAFTGMTRQREEDARFEDRQLDYDTGLPMASATRYKGQ